MGFKPAMPIKTINMSAPDFLPRLTGCFAMPAAENPTMAMVEAAYRHHHLHWRYINCEVPPEGLGDAVRGAKAMGWVGFNCSLPHKVAVIPFLDGLGESARVIGAVNTVVRRGDFWIGENTDGKGFVEAIREVRKAGCTGGFAEYRHPGKGYRSQLGEDLSCPWGYGYCDQYHVDRAISECS
jgi:shikimate 5-dehydrogenase